MSCVQFCWASNGLMIRLRRSFSMEFFVDLSSAFGYARFQIGISVAKALFQLFGITFQ